MPICPRCGKELSTQQALGYHLKKSVCSPKSSLKGECSLQFDIYVETSLTGNIIFIDEKYAKLLGYTASELIGTYGYDYIDHKFKENLYKMHIEFLASKVIESTKFDIVCKNNEIKTVSGHAHFNKDKTGLSVHLNFVRKSL